MKRLVLIIEDDKTLSQLIARNINRMGHETVCVNSWEEADQFLEKREPDLIVTDVRLPDANSLERLPDLVNVQPVIVLTAYGSVRNAVDSMKAGAFDYLVKPINPEELILQIQRALDDAALRNNNQFYKRLLADKKNSSSFMIGESQALQEVKQLIEAVAQTDMTVLIQGESGAGKELVARAVHLSSPRSDHNFVAVDCCTIQEKLFESELFGHESGAFTGADRQKKGLIEGASGGTLFLDEIGEINSSIQAKLLRILETGTFRRLGGTKDLNANIRVVVATNRDLEQMAQEGSFRQDLYFRLCAFTITTPPLRNRREDIPHLVKHFLRNHDFSRRINKKLAPSAMRKLVAYDWPGNVRELKNVVERAIILSRDKPRIEDEHLAFAKSQSSKEHLIHLSFEHDPTLEELGAHYLNIQLQKHSGRRAKVAEIMGISERSVYRMLKRFEQETH